MYQNPRKFFGLELLFLVIGIVSIGFVAVLTGVGGIGVVIGAILVLLILLSYIIMFIISIVLLVKYIADKENEQSIIMYLVNPVFSFLVLAGFGIFLFVILIGTMTILLPFLA